jgi:2-polyprenyl-3-methyl-5-hydroxy-6-metoxy-1,4-benzoquinol methylase
MRSTKVWKTQHELALTSLAEHLDLYHSWILPNKYSDFSNLEILDAGSGPGIQAKLYSNYAKKVTAVDLEAIEVTKTYTKGIQNIDWVSGDISKMQLNKSFDVVNCVGTIHHTDNPTKTFENLYDHLKPGGRMIIWAYSKEGNFLMEKFIEPIRQRFLSKANSKSLTILSWTLTLVMKVLSKTLYQFKLNSLPYFEYMENFKKMTFERNLMNVYDKLNAPQQYFIPRSMIESWFDESKFKEVIITSFLGVSWRATGIKL